MKDLKSQFDEYQSPVTEQSWQSIAQDAIVVRHNRMCKLRKVSIISATTAAIVAAVITVIYLSTTPKTPTPIETSEPIVQEPHTEQVQQNLQEVDVENTATESSYHRDHSVSAPTIITGNKVATSESTPKVVNVPNAEKSVSTQITAPVIENKTTVPDVKVTLTPKSTTPAVPNNRKVNSTPTPTEEPVVAKANSTSTVHSETQETRYELFIPNSFTPNGDGINDIFKPVANFPVTNFEMSIYSRSGDRMFTSRNIEGGWDGQKYGTLTQDGVYLYVIKFTDPNGDSHTQKGQVILFK